jgi:hypothetical protein
MTEGSLTEYDSTFCANSDCMLYVRPGDGNVQGSGNWAELAGGIIVGRRRVDAIMLCDRCTARVMNGEVILATRNVARARIEDTPKCRNTR